MAKKLSTDDVIQIEQELQNNQSAKRRSSAKKIGKNELTQLGDQLYNAYKKECEDKRTWETQTEMILALGRIGYKNALQDLEQIIKKNEPHDMITIAAARSYVRLKRANLNDAKPVIELMQEGNLSVLNGALGVLTYDDMKPSEDEIKKIIALLDTKQESDISIRGLSDPRSFLISAMSKWDKKLCSEYLNRFVNSDNSRLKTIAESAINGKKSHYE